MAKTAANTTWYDTITRGGQIATASDTFSFDIGISGRRLSHRRLAAPGRCSRYDII